MRSTLFSFTVLSLLTVSAAQQPATPVTPDDGAWPPAGAFRPGNGVVLPRVVLEAKPQYTGDAMRAKIEGKVVLECIVEPDGSVQRVRILRSLDKVYGLDEQAVKVAKQWRFAPGTKDNVAVPVMITIEMAFTMGGRPRPAPTPAEWPEVFAADVANAIDTSEWIEDVSDVSGLAITVAHPTSWAMRKGGSDSRLLAIQSAGGLGTRILFINKPKPVRFEVDRGVSTDILQRLADAAKQSLTTPAGTAQVMGIGQTRTADRFWLWYDLAVPTVNWSRMPSPLSELSAAMFDGARMWTFITTAGAQEIPVGCAVLFTRGLSETGRQQELRQAGAEFAAMLKRISIQAR